jgi:hypothetical protein
MPDTTFATGQPSAYRVILQDTSTKPFNSLVTERALLQVLETQYCFSVWNLSFSREGGSAYLTFRSKESATQLLNFGSIVVNDITIIVKPQMWQPNTQSAEDEEKIDGRFSKPISMGKMKIAESRDLTATVCLTPPPPHPHHHTHTHTHTHGSLVTSARALHLLHAHSIFST